MNPNQIVEMIKTKMIVRKEAMMVNYKRRSHSLMK